MDDDRLARAREGDLDAFLDLVRPRTGRLLRLAAIGAGDPVAAHRAASTAVRTAWRDVRRLRDVDRLDHDLEQALIAALPRRRTVPSSAAPAEPLDGALRVLSAADRVALGRCLDPLPDRAALAVAGRLGVEVDPGLADASPGVGRAVRPTTDARARDLDPGAEIIDLDGPLVGWDLPWLRAALGSAAQAAMPGDPAAVVARLRDDLAGTRPDGGAVAALRGVLPGPAVFARGAALACAAVVGIGVLLATAPGGVFPGADAPSAEADPAVPATAAPDRGAGAGSPDGGRGSGAWQAAAEALADFPDEVEGLTVIGVVEARRLAGSAAAAGRSIAIRGWLSGPTLRDPCLAPSPATPGRAGMPALDPVPVPVTDPLSAAAAFCHRESVLREAPGAQWGGAHLHPQLLPGTGLGRTRRLLADAPDNPLPVVVLAHFGDPRVAACSMGGRHCGEELVIDRIAWADGRATRPAVAVRPTGPVMETVRSGWDAMELAEAAYGGIRAVSVAGVPAADLATVEPAAAGVPSPSGFAWLVRAIVEPSPRDATGATRTWLVVDDRTGQVIAAPEAVAAATGTGTGFFFPRQVDGMTVSSVADVRALAEAGLPEGTAVAVAGWLSTPALAGSCLEGTEPVDPLLGDGAAFCRRGAVLRGPTTTGRSLSLQLAPGTPSLPIADAVRQRRMPVPVVALVESGSPRSEPCWPTDDGCGRQLLLERLLWVDGSATEVAIAELDRPGLAPPRLSATDAGALAAGAAGDRPLVSIIRVPADERGAVAPGAEAHQVSGEHAWIVRVRGPLTGSGTGGRQPRLEQLWWLLVDDAAGRAYPGSRPIADLPDEPPLATPPG